MTLGDSLGPHGKRPELSGIGGWLAFLCVSLLFLTPLGVALDIIRTVPDPQMSPVEKGIGISLDIALGGFAILTGISLSRVRPNALRVAKIFFFVTLTFWLLVAASAALLSDGITASLSVRSIVVSAAWLAYLYRSQRVRNTYSRVGAESAAEVFR